MDLDTDYRRKVALFVVLIVIFMFISVYMTLKFCRCCAHVGDNMKGRGFFQDFEAIFFDSEQSSQHNSTVTSERHYVKSLRIRIRGGTP